jgi:hypothetical protein
MIELAKPGKATPTCTSTHPAKPEIPKNRVWQGELAFGVKRSNRDSAILRFGRVREGETREGQIGIPGFFGLAGFGRGRWVEGKSGFSDSQVCLGLARWDGIMPNRDSRNLGLASLGRMGWGEGKSGFCESRFGRVS